MKKSRFLYLHPKANAGKVAALEVLQVAYTVYLQECVDAMLAAHRFDMALSEKQSFFPPCSVLSNQIVKNVRDHAIGIVSGWAAGKYTTTLRAHVKGLFKAGEIDEALALCIVGKGLVSKPSGKVTQAALDLYWKLLLDEQVTGKRPTISARCGMRMCQETATLGTSEGTAMTGWWLRFSTLERRHRLDLPLVASPYVTSASAVSKGILARKDKRGRWRFEVVDKKEWEVKVADETMPRVGLDVGLNVVAATSDGRLLGRALKPHFDRLYQQVKAVRANRQRQGLPRNSPRLDALESRLSGTVKTMVGEVANDLVRSYPGHAFVIEDLDLSRCRGQKRMAYRALHRNLETKAPCVAVNPAYTSQTCPSCGFPSRRNRHGINFACIICGRKAHADVVGGTNLLRRSEDEQIDLDDDPAVVRPILRARALRQRNGAAGDRAAGGRTPEPVPSGQRLTTRVPKWPRTASNQVPAAMTVGS